MNHSEIEALFKKLKLDDTKECLVLNAPTSFSSLMLDLKIDTEPAKAKLGNYDYIQVFATTQSEMEDLILHVAKAGKYDCFFWACYPKKSSKIKSDMQRESVWKALTLGGLEAISIISIDETWSALRGRPSDMIGKPKK